MVLTQHPGALPDDERVSQDAHVRWRRLELQSMTLEYVEVVDVDPILEAAIERDEHPPYGAVPWASSIAIAEQLTALPLSHATLVDVGAGCGIVSLAAAKLGARCVALDIDPLARDLLARAAQRQALSIEVQPFDILSDAPLPRGDLYVFADLLYEAPLARAVARRVREAMATAAQVWVGDPGRAGRETFQLALLDAEIMAEFVDREAWVPGDGMPHRVGIYHWQEGHTHCL
jgi:predicted nicotinamide N-methyase